MKITDADNKEKWTAYILRCADDSLYTGITVDLAVRIKKHNLGLASKYTRSRRPVVLVWHEDVGSESAARKREAEIKGWEKTEKEELIRSNSLESLQDI